jgi:hypothetical protein
MQSAMSQPLIVSVPHRLGEVLDDAVRVEIDLPWVMQFLRDIIAKRVHGRGIALLERPPDEV